MMNFFLVGAGGFIGASVRYAIAKFFVKLPLNFPYATLVANVLACVLMGVILGLNLQSNVLPEKTKLFFGTGILGGLSTFSTFSAETLILFKENKNILALSNIFFNVALSICAVFLGIFLGKLLIQKGN